MWNLLSCWENIYIVFWERTIRNRQSEETQVLYSVSWRHSSGSMILMKPIVYTQLTHTFCDFTEVNVIYFGCYFHCLWLLCPHICCSCLLWQWCFSALIPFKMKNTRTGKTELLPVGVFTSDSLDLYCACFLGKLLLESTWLKILWWRSPH